MSFNYENLANYPDVLSLQQASEYIGASKDTIRKLCLNGNIKHIRVGKLYKITKQNMIEFLEKTS